MKKIILLFCILLVASVLRLFMLGGMPPGLTNDESSYIYSSYSVWKTGRGVDGTFLPLSFNTDSSNSPVPIYIDAPFVGILGVSPFSGRLPYALLGIASVFLTYLIAKKLFNNEWIGLLSAFVLAISPWHIHVSRAAFDSTIALFFYLWGIYLFLKNREKGNILWSLIPFLLGFYSYHATKFFFLFFLPFLLILFWPDLKKRSGQRLMFIACYILILISFAAVLHFGQVTRQETTILTPSDKKVAETVDYERATSTAPFFVQQIFNNKLLTMFRVYRENFLEPFSPQFLFLYGDTNSSGLQFGTFSRGTMYIIEFPLLFFGLYFLCRKYPLKTQLFIFGSLLCAVVPSGFAGGKTFALRDLPMIPFLSLIVGVGIYNIFGYKFSAKIKYVLFGITSIFYIFLVSGYLYQYYTRYSIYGSEAWMLNRKQLAQFILSNKNRYTGVYLAWGEKIFLAQYGIFGQIDPNIIQKAWKEQNPVVGNVHFNVPCLPDKNGEFTQKFAGKNLYIAPVTCNVGVSPQIEITNPQTNETIWKIYAAGS